MPKYLVPITRDVTETTYVDVEASSPLEARELALSEVVDAPYNFDFILDDCSGGDPYFAGGDDLEAIEVEGA